ncbi:hypothetical protein [Streptomyces sp. NPDC002187]|uniref:hypothetical protein n=1 Tax=Streptomyces sp. NPDC002187 TaxID=3364637 RepID=UPI0036B98AA8
MSEEEKPSTKPTLTPQEELQQKEEVEIDVKYAISNVNDLLSGVFGLGFGSRSGTTSFDGCKLNNMLDFLESANPSHLEDSAESLKTAKKAINEAAKELDEFVKATHWEGEGAEAFKKYGSDVVKYAWGIGRIANAVGAQMEVASAGLTSVRNARPPRDVREVKKEIEHFRLEERSQDNLEFQKALQVERDRQEAINQMNRLASFYAVSRETLAGQPMPDPPQAYKTAVPMPSAKDHSGLTGYSTSDQTELSRPAPERGVADADFRGTENHPRTEALGTVRPAPEGTVGPAPDSAMEIDQVAAPPAPPTTAPVGPTTQPAGPPNGSGPVLPTVGPVGPPVRGFPPRTSGAPPVPKVGGPSPTGPVGRSTPTGGGPTTTGRATGPVGRTGMPGTGGPTSPVGRATGPVGRAGMPGPSGPTSPVGRPGATGIGPGVSGRPGPVGAAGQTPIAGRPTTAGQPLAGRSGAPGGPRAARADGIAGGTPQRAAGNQAGSRIPRGTVIGGQGSDAGRPSAARPSQAGVVGANPGANAARPAGRGTPSVNGVVGTPRNGSSGSRSGTGTPAAGRAPLGGGRGNERQSGHDNQDREASPRPDYLTEDEETRSNRRRGAVPPVID